jgi:hypothetical protein
VLSLFRSEITQEGIVEDRDVCDYIIENTGRLGFNIARYQCMRRLDHKCKSRPIVIKQGDDVPYKISGAGLIKLKNGMTIYPNETCYSPGTFTYLPFIMSSLISVFLNLIFEYFRYYGST